MAQLNSIICTSNARVTGNIYGGNVYADGKVVTRLTATPTSGQIVIADGTAGGVKTSGYTIATSVPSGAVFTDKYHTTGSWSGLTYTATANGGAGALAFTVPTGTTATTVSVGNHTHGNIQSGGTLQTTDVTIASGDKLVITDSSDSNKVARASLSFGTATTTYLRNDGTWATPTDTNNAVTQTATNTNANYEVLFSGTADNTTRTEGTRKYSNLTFNPSTGTLTTTIGSFSTTNIDTGNITELNAGNLIVTGSSRFLNTIHGGSNIVVGTLKSGTTLGQYATAFGVDVEASGYASYAEGGGTQAYGQGSHAEGASTKALGLVSHAEGLNTTASNNAAHAEGESTTASGINSHAEGNGTTASGTDSHAEGNSTTASNLYAHAEGYNTTASSNGAHAEGCYTTASGNYSHSEGVYTTANHLAQHVFGEYNIADTSTAAINTRGTYIEIVGNGTADNARSNARTLDWSGNEWLAGNLTLGGTTSDITLTGTNNTWDGTNTSLKTALGAKSSVSFTQTISSGSKIGSITINGTSTNLYCDGYSLALPGPTRPTEIALYKNGSELCSITPPYADIAGCIGSSTVGGEDVPIYINAGVPTITSIIIYSRSISGSASHLLKYCSRVFVLAYRQSATNTCLCCVCDQWHGITYISKNDALATIAWESGADGDGYRITNKISSAINLLYFGWKA